MLNFTQNNHCMKTKILVLLFTLYCQSLFSNTIFKDTIKTKQEEWFTNPDHFILKQYLTTSVIVRENPLERSAFKSIQEGLQGKVAGLQIISQGGKISQDLNVFIRGNSSFTGKSQPLIIIDGHRLSNSIWERSNGLFGSFEPINPLSFINQYDIESTEIIKDGLAGALYGPQGENGAIVITTKKGYNSKPRFSFNTEIGIAQPSKKLELMNRSQFIEMFRDGYNNDTYGQNESRSWQELLSLNFPYWKEPSNPNDPALGPDTDWQKLIFRNSLMHHYNLSVRGGTSKLRYYSSLFWSNQKAPIIGSNSQNIAGQLNIEYKPLKWLTMSAGVSPTITDFDRTLRPNYYASPMMATLLSPLDPLYIPNTNQYNNLYKNPVPLQSVGESTFKNILINASVKADITNYLFFSADLWGQQSQLKEKKSHDYIFDSFSYINSTITNYNYSLTFSKPIYNKHRITLSGGCYLNKEYFDYDYSAPQEQSRDSKTYRNHNFYLNASLILYNRFFINQIIRQDFLSPSHNSKSYIYISGEWHVIEPFPANSGSGSKISSYSSVAWQVSDFLSVNSSFGSIKSNYQEQYRWQTTEHFNFGLSFACFDKRLSGDLNYFDKRSSNLRYHSSRSPDSIISLPISLRNNGVEVTLNTINLDKLVKWNTSVNLTFLKDKIIEFDEIIISGSRIFKKGLSPGVYNLLINAGVDPAIGKALYYTDNSRTEITANPYLASQQVTGNSNPKFYGGITNNLTYKSFDLSFFWQFVYGNDILSGTTAYYASSFRSSPNNKSIEYYNNYWRKPGDLVIYPKPSVSIYTDYTTSTLYLLDGSYLRLNDLTIGYTLPSNVSLKYKIASARFFARGTNLLTITKYPGWTPDIYEMESLNVPQSRIISLGVQIGL